MIEIFDTANFIDFIDSEVNAEKENINEEKKSSNKMLWIGKMNNIKNMVEEIVLKEDIYV